MFSKCCQTNLTRNKQNLSIILLLIGIHFLILFPSFAQTNKTNISQNIQKLLQNCDQFKSVNFETLEEAIFNYNLLEQYINYAKNDKPIKNCYQSNIMRSVRSSMAVEGTKGYEKWILKITSFVKEAGDNNKSLSNNFTIQNQTEQNNNFTIQNQTEQNNNFTIQNQTEQSNNFTIQNQTKQKNNLARKYSLEQMTPLLIELTDLYIKIYSNKIGKHQVARRYIEDLYEENKMAVTTGSAATSLVIVSLLLQRGRWKAAAKRLTKWRKLMAESVKRKGFNRSVGKLSNMKSSSVISSGGRSSQLATTGTRAGTVGTGSTLSSDKIGGEENGNLNDSYEYVPMSPLSYVFSKDLRHMNLGYEEQRALRTNIAIVTGIGTGYLAAKFIEPRGEAIRNRWKEKVLAEQNLKTWERKLLDIFEKKNIDKKLIISKIANTPVFKIFGGVIIGITTQMILSKILDIGYEWLYIDLNYKNDKLSAINSIERLKSNITDQEIVKTFFLMEKWYLSLHEYMMYYTGEYRNLTDEALSDYYQSSICYASFVENYFNPFYEAFMSTDNTKAMLRQYKTYLSILSSEYSNYHIPFGEKDVHPINKNLINDFINPILNRKQSIAEGKYIANYEFKFEKNYKHISKKFEDVRIKLYQESQDFISQLDELRQLTKDHQLIDNMLEDLREAISTKAFNCCSENISDITNKIKTETEIYLIEQLYDASKEDLEYLENAYMCQETPYYKSMKKFKNILSDSALSTL
ncbi:MAG: hypothetical protein KDD58_08620 [Bdellovibrionales bacterium]|nr:hypothetical protein [Bdellovibrionales bacterium]